MNQPERRRKMKATGDPTTLAPEICVEVLRESNTAEEMANKRALYREAGAEEIWLVDLDGRARFFWRGGEGAAAADSRDAGLHLSFLSIQPLSPQYLNTPPTPRSPLPAPRSGACILHAGLQVLLYRSLFSFYRPPFCVRGSVFRFAG